MNGSVEEENNGGGDSGWLGRSRKWIISCEG